VLKEHRFLFVTGHPTNVYDRFLKASAKSNARALVRVTADNPLVDLEAIQMGIEKLLNEDLDYLWMTGVPAGFGVDIFRMSRFRSFENTPLTDKEKEHLVTIFRDREELKGAPLHCDYPEGAGQLRFTVDTEEDYLNMERTFSKWYKKEQDFDLKSLVRATLKKKSSKP